MAMLNNQRVGSFGIKPPIFKGLIMLTHTEIGFDWILNRAPQDPMIYNMFPDCISNFEVSPPFPEQTYWDFSFVESHCWFLKYHMWLVQYQFW